MDALYVARHGQDGDNAHSRLNGRRDTPLTEIGIEQASVLARMLREQELGLDKIYSSPLQRAYRTAEVVAQELGLSAPEKNDLLLERDFGIMTGRPIAEIQYMADKELIRTTTITYFLQPEGAESFPQVIERAKKLLRYLRAQKEERVLLVTHGDIGKMIYAAFYELPWKNVLTDFHFGNSEVLLLAPGTPADQRHIHKTVQHNL